MLNHFHRIPKRMPIKVEFTPMLPGLSPVGGKMIEVRLDDACMSSDGGLLALQEIEQRLAISVTRVIRTGWSMAWTRSSARAC